MGGRVIRSFSIGILMLLLLGGIVLYMTIGDFIVSLKPAKSFEDLAEMDRVKTGMHIKGILYAYGPFAKEETYTQNSDGSRTPGKTSSYYFVVPVSGGNGCIALEVSANGNKAAGSLTETDETVEYSLGGVSPTTVAAVDGITKKMEDDMKKLFQDYLKNDLGFTEEQIEGMSMIVIEQPYSMMTIQIMFLIGLILFALGIFLLVRNYKKNAPNTIIRV